MAHSNLLGEQDLDTSTHGALGIDTLGPSDSSDTGSDTVGTLNPDEIQNDSDRNGTGERAAVESKSGQPGADILPDHLVRETAMDDQPELDTSIDADAGGDAGSIAAADDAAQDEVERLAIDESDGPAAKADGSGVI